MREGWIRLYRKSIESPVFANEHLWKLWCLCLLKANHKTEYVPIEGIVEPIKINPGQFITGRYELHADYHQRRKGYKKRFPSPLTVWRWLHFLKNMQNLNIKSFSKYSIISINNWKPYQENEQQMNNRRTSDEHKQEVLRINKNKESKDSCRKKTDPDVKTFILEWTESFSKKFNQPYTPNWAKEGKLVKEMLKIHSLPKLRELMKDFFSSPDPFIKNAGYTIGVFKTQLNKLIVERETDPFEQAKKEQWGDIYDG